MEIEESFYDHVKDYFGEYFSSIENNLRTTNVEYERLNKSLNIILKKYPKLENIYNGKNIEILSKEECKALLEVLECMREIHLMQIEQVFISGFKEAFLCFERSNLFIK